MERELAAFDLHKLGLPLPDDLIRDLKQLVEDGEKVSPSKADTAPDQSSTSGPFYDGRRHLWLYKTPEPTEDNQDIANDPNYYDRIPQEWKNRWKDKEIKPEDWKPKGCPEDIPQEVMTFVLSANPRFDQLIAYEPFWLYCEYARRANQEATSIEDFQAGSQEWVDFALDEVRRSQVCLLYGCDRYGYIKDDSQPSGWRKYHASTPQALLCWLKNIGVNYVLAKGRQAAITSTEMLCASIRVRVMPSYKGILLTDDKEETGKSIFAEKFMATGRKLPYWMQPKSVLHDSTMKVMYSFSNLKGKKGENKLITTEMSLFGSRDTQAVNGTTPTDLYIDEAQNVSTLQKILMERRPTEWASVNGKMRKFRQSFVWGTAASSNAGKGAFEDRYKQVKTLMIQGKPTGGWIAVFFDAFCRPYMSKDIYFREYHQEYMSDDGQFKGMSVEERMAMFASHFPMSDEDAFAPPANTVVPSSLINEHIKRILAHYPQGPIRGYFEPIYDHSKKQPEGSYFPYFVKGARFVKASDLDMNAPVFMFKDREDGCIDNYWQGTDPIQSYTGMSRMASVIMASSAKAVERDKQKVHIPAPVCWVNNIRSNNVKDSFAQVKLMGIYYANHGQQACPELVEVEQGHNYIEFIKSPALLLEDSLVYRTSLSPGFQIGGHMHGMAMKEATKSRGHGVLLEMVDYMGHNIWSFDFWSQLKNIEHEEGKQGSIKWGTSDVRRFNDDLVVAMLLAFIAMTQAGMGTVPRRIGIDEKQYVTEWQPVRVGMDFEWREVQVEV